MEQLEQNCIATSVSGSFLPLWSAVCGARRRVGEASGWKTHCVSERQVNDTSDAKWDKLALTMRLLEKDCDAVLWLDADVVAQRRCVALPVVTAPIRFSVDPHGTNTGLFLARRDAIPVFADVLRRRHSFATSGTPTQSALKAHYRERGGTPSLFPASFVSYGLGPNASTAPFWHVTGNRHVKRKRFSSPAPTTVRLARRRGKKQRLHHSFTKPKKKE